MEDATSPAIRLLIVDDEVSFGRVLVKRLSKRGFAAEAVSSGREALVRLRRADYDAVLLDLKMEHMGGLELLEMLRKLAPEMPVVIMTGHGAREEAREAIRLGAFDYLLKPCDFDEVVRAVERAVAASCKTGDVLPPPPG